MIGEEIAGDERIENGQVYVLLEDSQSQSEQSPNIAESAVPHLCNATREHLLFRQQGWVAVDEMSHYMYMMECYSPTTTCGIFEVANHPDHHLALAAFLLRVITEAGTNPNSSVKAFVILRVHHWIPVVVQVRDYDVKIITTPEAQTWLQTSVEQALEPQVFRFATSFLPQAFPADCGFQAIGWILSILFNDTTEVPFSREQANQWRTHFHNDLVQTGKAHEYVHIPLSLGGTQVVRDQLQALVSAHGVASSRSKDCAEHLLQVFGVVVIQQILQSPRPWADLKARASLQKPPIRIVLADELRALIQAKAQGPQVGHKAK